MGQTFSKTEREIIMEATIRYADGLYVTNPNYPIRAMVVPSTDLSWDCLTPQKALGYEIIYPFV